jgi:hypothetical protein
VVVRGLRVRQLSCHRENGFVYLSLDDRYGLRVTEASALEVVPFIAECMAAAAGWSSFPHPEECPRPRRKLRTLLGTPWERSR